MAVAGAGRVVTAAVVVQHELPLNLGMDDIDDLVGQAGNVLVAEVDGDAGLLLLQLAGRLGGGTVVDVLPRMLKGGLCEGHDLVVGNGRGRVVAHGEQARGQRGGWGPKRVVAYMLLAATAKGRVQSGTGRGAPRLVVVVGAGGDAGPPA